MRKSAATVLHFSLILFLRVSDGEYSKQIGLADKYQFWDRLLAVGTSHFTIAAYGQTLAIHAANAALSGTSEAAFMSNLGYSGEQWDASLRMQNLRARFYDPRNGRFIGLDPFAGNMQDPQSLHKYAYVHGDPIGSVDPTGLAEFSIAGISVNISGRNIATGLAVGLAVVGAYGLLSYLKSPADNGSLPLYQARLDALHDAASAMSDVTEAFFDGGLSALNLLFGTSYTSVTENAFYPLSSDIWRPINRAIRVARQLYPQIGRFGVTVGVDPIHDIVVGSNGHNFFGYPGLHIRSDIFWEVNPLNTVKTLLHEVQHEWFIGHYYIDPIFEDSNSNYDQVIGWLTNTKFDSGESLMDAVVARSGYSVTKTYLYNPNLSPDYRHLTGPSRWL